MLGFTLFVDRPDQEVVLADTLALLRPRCSSPPPAALIAAEAWVATLAYTLQLYFDFSGYSDMAIGLALMFGFTSAAQLRLALQGAVAHRLLAPLAHDASASCATICTFRWAATGAAMRRRYVNLMITMLLGGLWHGAGWTFVLWGGAARADLVIHHAWHAPCGTRLATILSARPGPQGRRPQPHLHSGGGWSDGFASVRRAWTRPAAFLLAWPVSTGSGCQRPTSGCSVLWAPGSNAGWGATLDTLLFGGVAQATWLVALLAIVFLLPNTQEWVRYFGGEPV